MKKISVIIPMYNSESFIHQCLQSVMRQTWKNLEIIVVNDGSTDRGPEICEKLEVGDSRIRLYNQDRNGVSSARNYALDVASGDYIFFLDSDDIIHPLLLEEMIKQMERQQAGIAFCGYANLDSTQLDKVFTEMSCGDVRPKWRAAGGAETEVRFHKKDRIAMSGIGGKMIRASLLYELRFDTGLVLGEDTWFLYLLISRQVRSVFSSRTWYCYRMHSKSVTQAFATIPEIQYFECARRIRDCEYQKGRLEFAMMWETYILDKMGKNYTAIKRMQNSQIQGNQIQLLESCQKMKEQAAAERKHPIYPRAPFGERLLFFNCFHCSLLYRIQGRCRSIVLKRKRKRL